MFQAGKNTTPRKLALLLSDCSLESFTVHYLRTTLHNHTINGSSICYFVSWNVPLQEPESKNHEAGEKFQQALDFHKRSTNVWTSDIVVINLVINNYCMLLLLCCELALWSLCLPVHPGQVQNERGCRDTVQGKEKSEEVVLFCQTREHFNGGNQTLNGKSGLAKTVLLAERRQDNLLRQSYEQTTNCI